MAEIQDSEFLRILRESPVVSPEEIRSAQDLQRGELDRQGSCRSLFAILREQGLIDERVARTLTSVDTRPGDVTPHTPTVVLHPPDETPAPGRPSSSGISRVRSARKRPPEVEAATADPRNTLGPYILVREVGKGGMGRVYRAWDENVGRWVAVKVIDTEDTGDRERFVREAQIAGRLNHPSIAAVFQAGEEGTRGYIAMQFIEGGPIDAQKLPLLSALALIRDSARALSYAHEQGVIHRDVKPGNLMLDGKGQVFLTDFGLAKEVVANAGTQLSITGTTFGTPQYMSPEQARGEHKRIDGRSDVYSLGATLYALLARRPPFTSTNLATLLLEVLDKQPPPVSRFNREISPELEMLVERSMAKEPGRRFPSMAAFAGALDVMMREGRYAGRYGLAKALTRRWLPRLAVAAALGAALWFGIPLLRSKPVVTDPVPGIYAGAVELLRTLEGQALPAAERRDRVARQVLQPLAEVLVRRPGDPRALAARVRALYAQGDREAAARELAALEALKDDDYRLRLVAALLELETALALPCPLPALEGPAFEWEQPPSAPAAGIEALARSKVAPDLAKEFEKDQPAIAGLSALAEGQYGKAADAFRPLSQPVFQAAWCRAAYLDRRFAELRKAPESKGRRERFGAGLALAGSRASALEALLEEEGTDAPRVHAALARLDGGGSVATHVEEGLKGAAPELQAALLAARLREQALTWNDDEKEYRRAMELAGAAPTTWSGRLAAAELRLGLGSRLQRSRGDGRPLFEEALRMADALELQAPGWAAPRLLGAQARLRLGRLEEVRAKLPEGGGTRALLTAAALDLAAAERERKAGGAFADAARAARRAALSCPGDPGEALVLAAAAGLLLAQDAAAAGKDETEHVGSAGELLTKALDREPRHVEALFHRARARFLQAEIARRGGAAGRVEGELARADADAALKAAPEFLPALYLRGIVNFSLGRDAEAVADWRALRKADAAWDTAEVREWIQRAEDRLKR